MYSAPDSYPIDLPTFHSRIDLPYTLTPGRAAGTFLAEVKNQRIIGSRFASGRVVAPAQDVVDHEVGNGARAKNSDERGSLRGTGHDTQTARNLLQLLRGGARGA